MKTRDFDVVVVGGGIVGLSVAAGLVRGGARVAVVERGPAKLSQQAAAEPRLQFLRRPHLGADRARNHILGGNGHYWGGGLMRPPSVILAHVLGLEEPLSGTHITLERFFSMLEKRYGVPQFSPRRPVNGLRDHAFVTAEIAMLPGRTRNVAAFELDRIKRCTGGHVFTCAALQGFEVDSGSANSKRQVRAVVVRLPEGLLRLAASTFVIAAGTIDSNLILLQHAADLTSSVDPAMIGGRLHDHWSVPLVRLRATADEAVRALLAPRFRGRALLNRHFETQSRSGWGARLSAFYIPVRWRIALPRNKAIDAVTPAGHSCGAPR